MKRDITRELLRWKSSSRRKPLLLQGARQTGKTYVLKEFGQREYEALHYFNFEEDSQLKHFFDKNLDPTRIIKELSIYRKCPIHPQKDLIIFDEIQVCNKALNALKYFQEKAEAFHIAAAGSLLGVKLSTPGSFPVGKVNFLKIYPLNFLEFLEALGETRYRQMIEEVSSIHPFPEAFHQELINHLRQYYFVGGMPEAVKHFADTKNMTEVREIQQEIIKSYVLDFAKHAPSSDIPKLSLIWDAVPAYLSRENKKFIFSALKTGARAREYEDALIWLEDAGLVYRVYAVTHVKFPLKQQRDQGCFKVYALDVGLLGAMAKIPVDVLSLGKRLFDEYEGALVENYVLGQFISRLEQPLYYWRSSTGQAEVDFLCEIKNQIYPLEVKSGINPRSKSLSSYDNLFNPPRLLRSTLLNLKQDGKILNIPLYAVFVAPTAAEI